MHGEIQPIKRVAGNILLVYSNRRNSDTLGAIDPRSYMLLPLVYHVCVALSSLPTTGTRC